MGDHGRGSLKDIGDGKWRYWPPMRDGIRPPSKTFRAKTKREAWEKADEIRARYASGDYTAHGHTLADVIEIWFERKRDLSASSVRNYRQTLDLYTLPALGKRRIDRLTVAELEQHYYAIPPSAAKNAHQVMRQVFRLALRMGWVRKNITADVERPKSNPRPLAPPDAETAAALFAYYPDERGLFFTLAAVTGCRRGELCAIRWTDITDAGLTIERTVTWDKDGKSVVGTSTKTGAARTVALGPQMRARLAALHAERLEHAGRKLGPYVFTRDDGTTPWHQITVSHWFHEAAKAVGYTGRLHDLRHLHATALLAAGVPITDVANRLGHAKSATTLKVYAHVLPGRDDNVAELAESIIIPE